MAIEINLKETNGLNLVDNYQVDYPQINNTILLLFCGYVFSWYLQIGYRIQLLGTIRFEYIYAVALIIAAVLFTPKIDISCPIFKYIILYIIVILIQIPFSYDFDTSWDVFVDRIIKFSFMSFFIISFVRKPSHLKYFLAAFLLACLKMGQEGLVGRISGGLVWENQGVLRLHGSTPMYHHPNSFAGMALGTLPFVYYLWPLSNKYVKFILVLIGMLSLNIVLYTGSRTGYVGFIALIIYIIMNHNNKKHILIKLLLISMLCIPLIPSGYLERFESIYTQKDKEGHSIDARLEILKDAWQIFVDHPLGVGVGAFPKIRMDTFGRPQDTHNLYLEIATNLGVQGFIIVGILIYRLITTLNNIRLSASAIIGRIEDSGFHDIPLISDLKIIEAVAFATIAFLIIRLTLGLFGMDLYEIYWWFAIGLTFSLYSMMHNIQIAMNKYKL